LGQRRSNNSRFELFFLRSKAILAGKFSLIFYYHKLNRYSFNALAGALDCDADLAGTPISLPKTEDELLAAVASAVAGHKSAIVALSIMTSQYGDMRRLIELLRSRYGSAIKILAGGPHVVPNPGAILRQGADIAFQGEAEVAFPHVLKRTLEGNEPAGIPGVAFRRGGYEVLDSPAQPVNIEAFPSFSPKRGMFGPIEITRGCPFACSFCQTSHIFGAHPRHRSISAIVRQAAALQSKRRKVVRLLSPNAFSYGSRDGRQLNLPALNEMLAALRETVSKSGKIIFGYFPSEVRPEHVTPDTLELLKRYSDNDEIVIGAQSGSARMLKACRRFHSVADIITAVACARQFGYKVIVDFILGLPGETEQDGRETAEMMLELGRMGARIHPHAFVPLPQTGFAAEHPGRIFPDIIRALQTLQPKHGVYGNWIDQRRLADRICRFREEVP
jgi:B12-binding domain/radical SAM domain protein